MSAVLTDGIRLEVVGWFCKVLHFYMHNVWDMQVKTSPNYEAYDVSLHRKHWKLYICLAKDCKSISTQPCLDIRSILAPQMSGCEKVSMLKQYVFKVGFLRRIPYSPSSRSRRGRRKHVQPHHQGVNWAKLQAGDSMCICLCVYLSLITRQCSLQASAKSRLINNHHHGPQTPVSSTEMTGRLKTSQKNMLPKDI